MPSAVVSVVVPSRGGVTRLPILMDALAQQEIDQPWEVIVVLDGDIDNSADVLDAYAARLPLRIIRRDSSTGVAAALAAGYAAAQGRIVIRCDDDLTPRPDFVARHLAWHHGRPAGAPPLGVIALTRDTFTDSAYAEAYGRPANQRLLAAAYHRPAEQRWMHWAACNSVPKAAYDAVGGFDTTMMYREDSELGYRLARAGVEMVIDPALEIEHRGPILNVAARSTRAFTSGASTRAFAERHPGLIAAPDSRRSLWNLLVTAQVRRLGSRDDAARLGRRIDVLLPLIPTAVRGKLIAWAVEAAAGAGGRQGVVDWVRSPAVSTASINVMYDVAMEEYAHDFADGTRPSRLPYGMERLEEHGFSLEEAPHYRASKLTTVVEHRTGVRLQPLRAWPVARRTDLTLAVWEHWAELPAILRHLPGPYRRKPLVTLVCWAAEDLSQSETRAARRARCVIAGSDLIAYLSRNQREIFLAHGARPEQLTPLTFGVPTTYFTGKVNAPRDIDFLAVGVDRGRDYDTLIEAVKGTALEVDLLTQPERAARLKLPANITVRGVLPPDRYRDLLRRAKVVVIPTHDYAYPTGQTVALNAAAAGCAVIVSHTEAMAEYFTDGSTALMPRPHDPQALRSLMQKLKSNDQMRVSLAGRGQRHVVAHHSSDLMWDQLATALFDRGFIAESGRTL